MESSLDRRMEWHGMVFFFDSPLVGKCGTILFLFRFRPAHLWAAHSHMFPLDVCGRGAEDMARCKVINPAIEVLTRTGLSNSDGAASNFELYPNHVQPTENSGSCSLKVHLYRAAILDSVPLTVT